MLILSRQHPVVTSQVPKVFNFVGQALEADVLTGQTLARVVNVTKNLVAASGANGEMLMQQFSPEAQQLIRGHFG